jgi:hypothetical protein
LAHIPGLLALAAGMASRQSRPSPACDGPARGARAAALALTLGRHALLLVALLLVHMVFSHARVLMVREERLSALLAVLSSLGLCARRFLATSGQYVAVAAGGALLVALFAIADSWLTVIGYRSQLVALVLFEAFVAARIALRLWLVASQIELQRALAPG